MPRRLMLALLSMCAAGSAIAASFNCTQAVTATEKRICANEMLSGLDDQLGQSYASALAVSSKKAALRTEQYRWLKTVRNPCPDLACLIAAYRARLAALASPAIVYGSLADAEAAVCRSLAPGSPACARSGGGDVGRIGAQSFQFATWCLDADPTDTERCDENATALFTTDADGRVTRWHLRQDDAGNKSSTPVIHRIAQGILLELPVPVQGTGNFNDTELFLRQGKQWSQVDITSWQEDLAQRLPKGRQMWKGIWPDWQQFTAEVALYAPKDANCCPTGGSATISLSLQGTRVAIRSLKIAKPLEP